MTANRVVVVEDEPIIAMDIRARLHGLGYAVPAVVATGREALTAVDTNRPDLVLMDIRLPGEMDGVAAAAAIRARYGIPVVYLTAYADEPTLRRARMAEPYGYILKPYDERDLHSTIQIALHRHQVENRLRANEEKYRRLVEAAPDAIMVIQDGRVVLGNPAAAALLQVASPSELAGRLVTSLLASGAAHFLQPPDEPIDATPVELAVQRADGAPLVLESVAIPSHHLGRAALQVIVRDVTQRREAEKAAAAQQTLIQALKNTAAELSRSLDLDAVLDAILANVHQVVPHDGAGVLLLENEEMFVARLDGLEMPELPVGPAPVLRWPIRGNRVIAQLVERREPLILGQPNWPDGPDVSWVQSYVMAPVRSRGELLGFLALVSRQPDFFTAAQVDRLQAFADHAAVAIENAQLYRQQQQLAAGLQQRVAARTAELEQERRRLQTILDTATEAIYLTDTSGRLQYANPATEQLTGYTLAELDGRSPLMWRSQETPLQTVAALDAAFAAGQSWQGEITNQHKSGRQYEAALSLSPIRDPEGRLVGFVHVQRDITHFNELNRLRDRFASRIGHELRTPVTTMKLYLDLWQRRPEQGTRYATVLQQEVNRLQRLVDGFIEFSLLTAQMAPLQAGPVQVNGIISETAAEAAATVGAGPEIQAAVTPGLPPALGDGPLIQRVLVNLLDNACAYTPTEGQVTLSTALQHHAAQKWVTFTVQDSGPGIAPEELPHIFDQFYRGRAAHDFTVPGAGLGLTICREIVQRLSGRITVASPPGQGAAFTVWLPTA